MRAHEVMLPSDKIGSFTSFSVFVKTEVFAIIFIYSTLTLVKFFLSTFSRISRLFLGLD